MRTRRRLAASVARLLRPVPAPLLQRAGRRPGTVGTIARHGLRGRRCTLVVGEGAGLSLDPGPSNPAYAIGDNELVVQQVLAAVIEPGDVVFDVGANVGFLTVVCARLVGPSGFVVAFEPSAANAQLVRDNLAANGFANGLVVCRAVAAEPGTASLQLAAYSGGHALEVAGAPPDHVGSVLVEVTTLDEVVESGVRPPDVVKIDVEGAEVAVLDGAGAVLAEHGPMLLIELDDATRAGHDGKLREVEGRLADAGYGSVELPASYGDGGWIVSHRVAAPAGSQVLERARKAVMRLPVS